MDAAGSVLARREIVIVGSQAVHAITDRAPVEVLVSLECDILLDEGDAASRCTTLASRSSPQDD
jgi:hypothetical protein